MDLDLTLVTSVATLDLPSDGRQSAAAAAIQRGTMRLLRQLGLACVTELPLASGRRADIVAIDPKGCVWIVEVKSSVEDFRADRKWPDYRLHCDRLFFSVGPNFPIAMLPADAGLMVADAYGARVIREGMEHPMSGATRKAVTLRIARAAALRLHMACDPDGGELV